MGACVTVFACGAFDVYVFSVCVTCFINPRRACAARVTVVVLCVCVCVCVSRLLICDSRN